jgi:hypothetical protein
MKALKITFVVTHAFITVGLAVAVYSQALEIAADRVSTSVLLLREADKINEIARRVGVLGLDGR